MTPLAHTEAVAAVLFVAYLGLIIGVPHLFALLLTHATARRDLGEVAFLLLLLLLTTVALLICS